MSKKGYTIFEIATIVIVLALCLTGCGQQAAQVQDQPSVQPQTTATTQNAAAQAPTYVNLYNGPVPGGGAPRVILPPADGEEEALTAAIQGAAGTGPGGATSGGQNATYSMVAYVNTQTGGTSAAPTGSTTGGAMGMNPSQNGTFTPTQHIQPELTFATPIAIGPNSSQQATATGRGSSADIAKQDQLQQAYTDIRAQNDFIRSLMRERAQAQSEIDRLRNQKPTSQPATPSTIPPATVPTNTTPDQ